MLFSLFTVMERVMSYGLRDWDSFRSRVDRERRIWKRV